MPLVLVPGVAPRLLLYGNMPMYFYQCDYIDTDSDSESMSDSDSTPEASDIEADFDSDSRSDVSLTDIESDSDTISNFSVMDIVSDSESDSKSGSGSKSVSASASEVDGDDRLSDTVLPSAEPDDRDIDTPGASAGGSRKRKAETDADDVPCHKKVHRKVAFEEGIVEDVDRRRTQYGVSPESVKGDDDAIE